MNSREISTLHDMGTSKTVISRSCLAKFHKTKLYNLIPLSGICLSSANYSKKTNRANYTEVKLMKTQTHTFMVCKNLTRHVILGLDSLHKNHNGIDWDAHGRLFLHRNGQ